MSRILSRYGSLSEDSLSSIVRGIYVGRKSGVLYLSNKNVSKRLYFNRGSIVFAGSDDDEDGLGELLVREGKIKRSDLEFTWQVMRQTERSLEETIVEMEFMSPGEIEAQGVRRMKAIIYSSFSWASGKYRFEKLENPVADEMAMNLSTADIILEGIRQIQDSVVRTLLGDLKGIINRPVKPILPYDETSLTSQEMLVLDLAGSRSDGASTAADLVAISPLGEGETLRCLCSLVSLGALEMEKPQPASAPPEPTKDAASAESVSDTPNNLPHRLGRYEIQKLLGRGSMGTVFLARDPAIERVVAIKLIQTATFLTAREQERYRNRFRREAKAAGKLIHPGIVTVFDIGHADQESQFIVMEYVEGPTLAALVQDKELQVDETVRVAHEILDALGYAHSFGIVHRDIKLANIMVTPGLHTKIMDFGIAHVVGTQLTPTEQSLGSPNYMAPEQLSKGTIDQRTDLFAFGVVLYRLLTGKLPFTGDSFAAAAHAILSEQPESPDRINPDVSPALGRVVLRCLAKDPAERFASAEEVRQALASDALDRLQPTIETGASAASPPPPSPTGGRLGGGVRPDMDLCDATAVDDSGGTRPLGNSPPFAPKPTRSRLLYAALATPVLLGLIVLLFVFSRGKMRGEESPEQANNAPLRGELGEAAPEKPVAEGEEPRRYEHLSDSDLFFTAGQEFEKGDLEESKAKLEELFRREPEFAGAPQLLAKVERELQAGEAPTVTIEDVEEATEIPSPPVLSDAQLYREAKQALERGDVEASKVRLEELLDRNPSFAGATELLAKASGDVKTAEPVALNEPQLFYEATLAREQGDFERSKAKLEELLQRNPTFAGASELLVEVGDEIWRQTLPVAFEARHRHRIGGCTGTLSLGAGRIRFHSDAHDWKWELRAIRIMERTDDESLLVETFEKDILGMGKPKRYRFNLHQPLDSETWTRYRRLAKRESFSEETSDVDNQEDSAPPR
jgi:serine/threonine-protein kinase